MNFSGFDTLTFLTFIVFSYHTNAIGIDDKLDFGGERRSHTSFRSDGIHRNSDRPIKHSYSVTKESNNDFDNIGIVCVNEGCNTTKSTDESEDSIKTDVVVHIETKVDLNHNKTKPVDDTPDIPIVIGTDSSNSDNYDGIRTEPKSIFIPSEPHYFQNTRPHVPESNIIGPYPRTSSFPFSSSRRADHPTYQNTFNPNPEVNINIKSLPPIALDLNNDMITDLKANGIKLSVPYFDPSLHNHHYGETPPPQFVYYPKNIGIINPVEFKVMRPNWKPSQWQNQFNHYRPSMLPVGMGVNCHCDNVDGKTDLHWYPNNHRRASSFSSDGKVSINDPGSQINDKLAPLN